jgi:hypothetical protein
MGELAFPPQGVGTPVFWGDTGPEGLKPNSKSCPLGAGLEGLLHRLASCRPRYRWGSLRSLDGRGGCLHMISFDSLLLLQEDVCGYERGEDCGDYAVHGEEGSVEFAEVAGRDERVFVGEEQRDGYDSGGGEFSECEGGDQGDQKQKHDYVEGARDPEGAGYSQVAGDGVESGVAVEVEILAGVEDVEAGDPEGDGGGENKDARVEGAANGDPGGGGRHAEGEAEHEMRPAGEALGVGIKEQDREGDRREPEREAIQLGGGENKDGAGDDHKSCDEGGREMAGRESAGAGAGIGGVDGGIGEAIEGHGGGTGG